MESFFAAYIPVSGEIQDGDTIRYDGEYYKVVKGPSSGPGEIEMDLVKYLHSNVQKVALLLCSYDIKEGDMVSSLLTDRTYFTKASKEHVSSNKNVDNNNRYFKVVGEVSPKASWVKDGDKIDVNELDSFDGKIIYYCLPLEPDKELSHRSSKQNNIWRFVKIRCRCCGMFR